MKHRVLVSTTLRRMVQFTKMEETESFPKEREARVYFGNVAFRMLLEMHGIIK